MLTLFLALSTLLSAARAASLPGVPLPFHVDAEGHWVLGADLPPAFAEAGVQPGWILLEVDGMSLDDAVAVQRLVATGPARDLRLGFAAPAPVDAPPEAGDEVSAEGEESTEGERGEEVPDAAKPPGEDAATGPLSVETIVVVRRAPLVRVELLGLLPWPDDLVGMWAGWASSETGAPLIVDKQGRNWELDPATGAVHRRAGGAAEPRTIPDLFWSLSDAAWVVVDDDRVETGDRTWARQRFSDAARVTSFQGAAGDHLLVGGTDGLDVYAVSWPRGTPPLPDCNPSVAETCLASGRAIAHDLLDRPGGREEALRHLGLACRGGVYRGCYEAVALEDARLAPQASACLDGDVSACNAVAHKRFQREADAPSDVLMGLLEYSCQLEGQGSLGERLRRLEDVAAGCMMLSQAHDLRGMPDQALLDLDQACVLGRAEACDQAAARRHRAFAARTVRECEDPKLPIAASCVELGRLLQHETVESATLDDFGAFLKGCSLGLEEGCVLLGDYVDRWGIENPRVVEAERKLRDACTAGQQKACLGAAHLLVRHEPRSDAYAEALLLFVGACDSGMASACVAAAEQRRIGKARKVDAPGQLEMWQRACDHHSARGCEGLGERLARSKKTWPQAYEAWTRACDLGAAHACTELGRLVQRKHREPWPGEQDPDDYLARACDNGDPEGCYRLAEDDLPRKGDPPEEAYLLLDRSCEGEYGQGCATLAKVHLDRRTSFDDEIAARHLATACDNGQFESCKELGTMYLRGKGVERDRQKARELAERFRLNARRRHLRFGPAIGLPIAGGGEAELVLPIPVGPAISFGGSTSYIPSGGSLLPLLVGQDQPEVAPDYQYFDGVVRLYPNTQARGLYGAAGFHQLRAAGGSLTETMTRSGWSARVGFRSDARHLYTGLEVGLAQYGVIDLSDFDSDKTGIIPFIFPIVSFSM
ncbi:MAG: sel1 repeat family protein, partial [Deltaproteobacteria bacterium]